MSIYTASIASYVAANFPNSQGYDTAQRSELVTWLDNSIVPLVDTLTPYNEVIANIDKTQLLDSEYGKLPSDKYEKVRLACEYTVNLVISSLTSSSISGVQVFQAIIQQAGVGDPIVLEKQINGILSTITGLPTDPVLVRNNVGEFSIQFPNATPNEFIPFANPLKCNFTFNFSDPTNGYVMQFQINNDNTLDFNKFIGSSNVGTGAWQFSKTDVLVGVLRIEVYP